MRKQPQVGFTLIELLTVIAIISILAALTAVGVPRVLERARITSVQQTMRGVSQILDTYFADHATYPARYGYRRTFQFLAGAEANYNFVVEPYLRTMGVYEIGDFGDRFSEAEGLDTNRDGIIDRLEFSPVPTGGFGGTDLPGIVLSQLYTPNNSAFAGAIANAEEQRRRPFIYVPVYSRNIELAASFWNGTGEYFANTWDTSDRRIQRITFPPPRYDRYVLISLGPNGDTGGVVASLNTLLGSGVPPEDVYHVLGLRTYYLAARDLNSDSEPDFDFISRTRQDGYRAESFPSDLAAGSQYTPAILGQLPREAFQNRGSGITNQNQLVYGPGPMIYTTSGLITPRGAQ